MFLIPTHFLEFLLKVKLAVLNNDKIYFPLELFKIICRIRESFARIHQGEFPDTKDIATYIANVDITRLRYFNYIQRSR